MTIQFRYLRLCDDDELTKRRNALVDLIVSQPYCATSVKKNLLSTAYAIAFLICLLAGFIGGLQILQNGINWESFLEIAAAVIACSFVLRWERYLISSRHEVEAIDAERARRFKEESERSKNRRKARFETLMFVRARELLRNSGLEISAEDRSFLSRYLQCVERQDETSRTDDNRVDAILKSYGDDFEGWLDRTKPTGFN